eukprot:COSAG06_NODE_48581_length_331_cov_0.668103_1_plen_48_part_01
MGEAQILVAPKAQKAQKGRGSGPNAGNCDHSSPADAVSIGPSALDRST